MGTLTRRFYYSIEIAEEMLNVLFIFKCEREFVCVCKQLWFVVELNFMVLWMGFVVFKFCWNIFFTEKTESLTYNVRTRCHLITPHIAVCTRVRARLTKDVVAFEQTWHFILHILWTLHWNETSAVLKIYFKKKISSDAQRRSHTFVHKYGNFFRHLFVL